MLWPAMGRLGPRLLRGRRSMSDVSDKQWQVYPEVRSVSRPAIFLEAGLSRMTAVQEQTTLEIERRRIQGGACVHAATRGFRLRRAVVHQGHLYAGGMRWPLERRAESRAPAIGPERIDEAALACSYIGNWYFGHSVRDDFPLCLLANETALPVRTNQAPSAHQQQYRDLLGLHAEPVASARFGSLLVFEDFGQNTGKRRRYDTLRQRIASAFPREPHRGVFLLRGNTGARRSLVNEEQVAKLLAGQGFRVVRHEGMSAAELMHAMVNARVVVSVEGSQLAHALLALGREGSFVVLQPPDRFNNVYKDLADCLDMNYAFVMGRQVDGGFEIPLDELSRTLDLLPAAA